MNFRPKDDLDVELIAYTEIGLMQEGPLTSFT